MVATKKRMPSVNQLRAWFISKGVEVDKKEAAVIHEMVREHRVAKKAKEAAPCKPKPKNEIAAESVKPKQRRSYSSSYGK